MSKFEAITNLIFGIIGVFLMVIWAYRYSKSRTNVKRDNNSEYDWKLQENELKDALCKFYSIR